MRSPRLAELVADELRSDILSGRVSDGGRLDTQEVLLARFNVGLPAIREAMRILEVEGLVTVHRGNVGGATVHLPTADNVAYMMAMVLECRKAGLDDVAAALHRLEPICAGMCAERADRAKAVVPTLRDLINQSRNVADDNEKFSLLTRQFHAAVVNNCGNLSMAIAVGSLEAVWNAHEPAPAVPKLEQGTQKQVIEVHERIANAIEAGDEKAAVRLSSAHVGVTQQFHMAGETRPHVMCALVRNDDRVR
jgi:DNA-binding FadR family transcriptional regulator